MFLGALAIVLILLPPAIWLSLTYKPQVYRKIRQAELTPEQRQLKAKRFVAQSLQLRNDICNEPVWEATFTDEEVNAWLAEDLMTSFADQIPAEVHEPRVAFEEDRAIVVFELDRGPIRSVITLVCRVRVPADNVLALSLEKIQAGIVPLPAEQLIDKITQRAVRYGLDISWEAQAGIPVAMIRYTTDPQRTDIVLERVEILEGRLRMAGRSQPALGRIANPTLPNRRVLQSTFPRWKRQPASSDVTLPRPTESTLRSHTSPFS
jgi:hypothetical protein